MSTPIENNTTELEDILRTVNELPAAVNPDDFVLKEELPASVREIVQEELESNDDFVLKEELPASVREIVQEELESNDDFVLKEELSASVTAIVQNELTTRKVPGKTKITVTLNASSWISNQQSVTASGVTEDNDVILSPASGSHDAYGEAGVRCTGQTSNRLTFTCTEKPSSNLSVNVLILT